MTATAPAGVKPAEDNADLTLEAARGTVRHEAAALEQLAAHLDAAFVHAVALIQGTAGRIVVTGIGKSGLVGRKIAATLACTGTPAFFVHAAEAQHGDLGMVTPQDTLIAISLSGRTVEVVDFARAAGERGSGVIAIVGQPDSQLGQLADHTLLLHVDIEADPIGVTPTTSSTATLALGDALAVALMTLSGFDVEQFRRHHPGGHLGERLRTEHDRPPLTSPPVTTPPGVGA